MFHFAFIAMLRGKHGRGFDPVTSCLFGSVSTVCMQSLPLLLWNFRLLIEVSIRLVILQFFSCYLVCASFALCSLLLVVYSFPLNWFLCINRVFTISMGGSTIFAQVNIFFRFSLLIFISILLTFRLLGEKVYSLDSLAGMKSFSVLRLFLVSRSRVSLL